MSVNFLMLLLGALILRCLAMRMRSTFTDRFSRLLGCPVFGRSVVALLRQHPAHADTFRARILPLAMYQLLFDATACAAYIAGIFVFPPAKFGVTDLALLQRGSACLVLIALVVDLLAFCRAFLATFETKPAPEEAD
jgi:hypothetical protein